MKYDCDIAESSFYKTDVVNDPLVRDCILASTTKCVYTLKSLAYYPHYYVRDRVYLNCYSTEEVKLAVKSYERFGHLTQ